MAGPKVPMTVTPPPLKKDIDRFKEDDKLNKGPGRSVGVFTKDNGVQAYRPAGKYVSPPRLLIGTSTKNGFKKP